MTPANRTTNGHPLGRTLRVVDQREAEERLERAIRINKDAQESLTASSLVFGGIAAGCWLLGTFVFWIAALVCALSIGSAIHSRSLVRRLERARAALRRLEGS